MSIKPNKHYQRKLISAVIQDDSFLALNHRLLGNPQFMFDDEVHQDIALVVNLYYDKYRRCPPPDDFATLVIDLVERGNTSTPDIEAILLEYDELSSADLDGKDFLQIRS